VFLKFPFFYPLLLVPCTYIYTTVLLCLLLAFAWISYSWITDTPLLSWSHISPSYGARLLVAALFPLVVQVTVPCTFLLLYSTSTSRLYFCFAAAFSSPLSHECCFGYILTVLVIIKDTIHSHTTLSHDICEFRFNCHFREVAMSIRTVCM
jgi:hypothetical protein